MDKMGKIRQKKIRWERSASPDVVNYRVYWSEEGTINYDSRHALVGDVAELLLPGDVPSFPLIRSTMTLGISAVDLAGSESDITTVSVKLDFTVPDAPRGLRIEDIQAPPAAAPPAAPEGLRVEDL
jgi:hypothetical protein